MSDELDPKLQQLVHEQAETARSPLEWTAVSERAYQTPAASRGRRWPAAAAAAVLIVAGVAVIALVHGDGSDTADPATLPAGPDGSNTVDSTDDQAIGGDDDSADTTAPPSSAPDAPSDPDDPAVTTRTARIVGVEVSESDTSITVTFLQAPVPCEQFHQVTLVESPTRVEITVTVEVREQRDGAQCPDLLTEETTTVELQAPLGERGLFDQDGTALR